METGADVLAVATDEDELCQHMSETVELHHQRRWTEVRGCCSDLDGDLQDDLISIDADGTLASVHLVVVVFDHRHRHRTF